MSPVITYRNRSAFSKPRQQKACRHTCCLYETNPAGKFCSLYFRISSTKNPVLLANIVRFLQQFSQRQNRFRFLQQFSQRPNHFRFLQQSGLPFHYYGFLSRFSPVSGIPTLSFQRVPSYFNTFLFGILTPMIPLCKQ